MGTFHFGTVSHGTLRTEDLLEAFADELERLGKNDAAEMSELSVNGTTFAAWLGAQNHRDKLINDAREIDPESEDASEMVNELIDALSEYAPSYCYFGTLEGDGADFGFWPSIGALEYAVGDGEVLKVNDLADIPAEYRGEVMLVNDHGNVTFGHIADDGEFCEVWACV